MNLSPIKIARIRKGLSQRELADASGYTQGYISFLESGSRVPSHENLLVISEALRCDLLELVSGRDIDSVRSEVIKDMEHLSPLELEKVLDYVQLLKKGRR